MASNVYTKSEILQTLASRGFFIDAYTLDTFFEKWHIEAIFEDEQGSEFFDKNSLDLVLKNLFNKEQEDKKEEERKKEQEEIFKQQEEILKKQEEGFLKQQEELQKQQEELKKQQKELLARNMHPGIQQIQNAIDFNTPLDNETNSLLKNIELSDGTPLIQKVQGIPSIPIQPDVINFEQTSFSPYPPMIEEDQGPKVGILEGAMQSAGIEFEKENPPQELQDIDSLQENQTEEQTTQNNDTEDFDDISLLSESLEAQEKLRQYVVSELSKKNVDVTPTTNEFKLDISERTLNMIARALAKKIVKHVNAVFSSEAKASSQLGEIQEKNKKLEQRTKELEEQNKKLKLLLAESNKNLNSYQPSIFGLFKKVNPNK